jgi:hypothetical protein
MPKKTSKTKPPAPLLAGWLLHDQAPKRSGLTEETIRRYCNDGKLPHQRIGSAPIIREDVLAWFLDNRDPRGRKPKSAVKPKRKKGGA